MDVRDWRCYGLAFASWPAVSSFRLGSLSPLLVLGIAAAWRWRDRLVGPAFATAAVIAAKLFPWTLAVWLLVRRRIRGLALTLLLAVAGVMLAWAVIAFHGLTSYPRMLSDLSSIQQGFGVSVVSGFVSVGFGSGVGILAALALTAAVFGLAWRASRSPDGLGRSFGLFVMAALIASPNVWPHYLVLVFVPIALRSRVLSPIWFVPMLAYLAPTQQTDGNLLAILPYFTIELIVLVALCRAEPGLAGRARGVSWPHATP